jgi:hypothetical protein
MSTYHGFISTIDMIAGAAGANVLDYSPVLFAPPKPGGDVVLWPLLKKVADVTDTSIYWMEDNLLTLTCTAHGSTGALTASGADVTLNLVAGQGISRWMTAGTLLRDTAAGSNEVILVTVVSTDALTIVRDQTASGVEAHAVSAVWEKIGHLNKEMSSFGTPVGRYPTRRTNYTAIFDDQVKMSMTEYQRKYYAIGDPWGYEVDGALTAYMRKLERAVMYSGGAARADTLAGYGSFYGIKAMIKQRYDVASATENYNSAYGTFSYPAWDNTMKFLWKGGYEGESFVMLVPPEGVQYAAYIDESAMRGNYAGELTRGMQATALKSTLGMQVPLIPCAYLASDEFLVLNLSRIKVRFFLGRELVGIDVPAYDRGDDAIARRFLTEMSLEMHNADTAHYWARGVTWPSQL